MVFNLSGAACYAIVLAPGVDRGVVGIFGLVGFLGRLGIVGLAGRVGIDIGLSGLRGRGVVPEPPVVPGRRVGIRRGPVGRLGILGLGPPTWASARLESNQSSPSLVVSS